MHCLLDDNTVLNVKHLSGLLWFGECPCEEPEAEIYRGEISAGNSGKSCRENSVLGRRILYQHLVNAVHRLERASRVSFVPEKW